MPDRRTSGGCRARTLKVWGNNDLRFAIDTTEIARRPHRRGAIETNYLRGQAGDDVLSPDSWAHRTYPRGEPHQAMGIASVDISKLPGRDPNHDLDFKEAGICDRSPTSARSRSTVAVLGWESAW